MNPYEVKIQIRRRNNWLLETLKTQFVYGQREILLDFIGYPYDYLIGGLLQHGVLDIGLNITGPSIPRIKTPRSGLVKRFPLYVYSKATEIDFNQNTGIQTRFIGAPWLYIPENSHSSQFGSTCSANCKNTVVFPSHQTLGGKSILSVNEIRKKISYWRIAAGSDICLCLFWVEYLDSNWHEACAEEAVKINCAGVGETFPFWGLSSFRLNFLPKLRCIIDSHSTVISEDISSVIFYSIDRGKSVGIFPDSRSFQKSDREKTPIEFDAWLESNMPKLKNAICSSEEYKSLTDFYLGRDSILSKNEMLERLRLIPKILTES
jgi:hypothetical protein